MSVTCYKLMGYGNLCLAFEAVLAQFPKEEQPKYAKLILTTLQYAIKVE